MPELLNPSDSFNPYCARFFDERFIVGSGNADISDMASWSSITADIVPGSAFVSKFVMENKLFKFYSTKQPRSVLKGKAVGHASYSSFYRVRDLQCFLTENPI